MNQRLRNALLVPATTLVIGGVSCYRSDGGTTGATPTVEATETISAVKRLPGHAFLAAYAKTEDAYLVDCRTPNEQASGMLPDALALDYRDAAFVDRAAELERKRPVFVYCARGGRSAAAAEVFDSLGFGEVVDLDGGYLGLDR